MDYVFFCHAGSCMTHVLPCVRLEGICALWHIFLPACVIILTMPCQMSGTWSIYINTVSHCRGTAPLPAPGVWYVEHIHKHSVSLLGDCPFTCPWQGSRKGVSKMSSFGLSLTGKSTGVGCASLCSAEAASEGMGTWADKARTASEHAVIGLGCRWALTSAPPCVQLT